MQPCAASRRRSVSAKPGTRQRIRAAVLHHQVLVACVLLTALAAVLFALGLGAHEIGRDEAVAVLLARRPVGEALRLLSAHEPSPAGYFLLLHLWPHDTEVQARLLSFVPAIGVPATLFLAARRLSLPAWTAGLFAATSPFLAYYAAEARMYAWLALLGTAALAVTALMVTGRPPVWAGIGLGALLAAGFYTHYFAAFTALGAIAALVSFRQARTAVVSALCAAVLFLPGAVMLAQQADVLRQNNAGGWQTRVDAGGAFQAFSSLLAGTGDYLPGLAATVLLLGCIALAVRRASAPGVRLSLVFGATGVVLPLLIGAATRFLTPRYLAASLPILLLLAATGLGTLPARIARPATLALVLVAGGLIVQATGRIDGQKLEIREALELARSQQAEPIVVAHLLAAPAAFYAPGEVGYAFSPLAVDFVGLYALPPGAPFPPVGGRPVVFLVYCRDPPTALDGYRLKSRTSYPGDLCADVEVAS